MSGSEMRFVPDSLPGKAHLPLTELHNVCSVTNS